jgi:hypothetical protein
MSGIRTRPRLSLGAGAEHHHGADRESTRRSKEKVWETLRLMAVESSAHRVQNDQNAKHRPVVNNEGGRLSPRALGYQVRQRQRQPG